ncbi:unnamed protein product [Sphacelaria rigidula]
MVDGYFRDVSRAEWSLSSLLDVRCGYLRWILQHSRRAPVDISAEYTADTWRMQQGCWPPQSSPVYYHLPQGTTYVTPFFLPDFSVPSVLDRHWNSSRVSRRYVENAVRLLATGIFNCMLLCD